MANGRLGILYGFIGAAVAVTVIGVAFAVYMAVHAEKPAPPAVPAPVVVDQAASAVPATVEVKATRAKPAVKVEEVASAEPAAPPVADSAAEVASSDIVAEGEKVAGEAESMVDKAAAEAEEVKKEVAYMEGKFEERKAQFLLIIDTYNTIPADEREAYLKQAFEELRKQTEAERAAAGMPARPADQRRVFGEMMRMAGDKMNDDEKQKVMTFMTDMMQSQASRFRDSMRDQLKVRTPPAPAPNTTPPAPGQ